MVYLETTENLELLKKAKTWNKKKIKFAIATVIKTWGSSPRPTGSQMLVSENSEIFGSVSGGCIEGSVIAESLEIINGGKSKILKFGVSNEKAWEVGLTCGGEVSVYIENFNNYSDSLNEMIRSINNRKPFSVAIDLENHKNYINFQTSKDHVSEIAVKKPFSKLKNIHTGISLDEKWFKYSYYPNSKIIIIGAVHIAQKLVPLSNSCGFSVEIIDPRKVFASRDRFPLGKLIEMWPDEYFSKNPIDKKTAIVTLTHDPKLDDPALFQALKSDAFFIGCLGSKKTHTSRIKRLIDAGFSKKDTERINGPIGLNISAKSPAEISVSIMAQIIQKHNNLTFK